MAVTSRRASHILAIDQGTTSTRAFLYRLDLGTPVATASRELPQVYPRDGWVEHSPDEIWSATVATCSEVLARSRVRADALAAIGITNQRETTLLWDRRSGEPLGNAICWQDRRGEPRCRALREQGQDKLIRERTGLLADSYFSATKLEWMLDQDSSLRTRAARGELAFGTVDTYLLWRLTGGDCHCTDVTNASRTMLYDIHRQCWDSDLLSLFDVPEAVLPEVVDSAGTYGHTDAELFGARVPVCALVGDQQGAMVGQGCTRPGMIKSTYGTGCFALVNTGAQPVLSKSGMVATVAYRAGARSAYALEGSIFNAGSTIQWLRDEMQLIRTAAQSEAVAASLVDNGGVYLVPAFTGLGAPHWDADARAAVIGLRRDTGAAHMVRAALEAVAYQTYDLLEAMRHDGIAPPAVMRVDGGMVENQWLMQFLADICAVPVERPADSETTVRGAAMLAAIGAGVLDSLEDAAALWQLDRVFEPRLDAARRSALIDGWGDAVARTRSFPTGSDRRK